MKTRSWYNLITGRGANQSTDQDTADDDSILEDIFMYFQP